MEVYQVTFLFEDKNFQPVTVKAADGETILDVALENNINLHHNCGGVCACTTCHVYIEEGMENILEMTDKEEDRLDKADALRLESRLGCQCEIHGNITVKVPDQSKYLGE